MTGEPDEPRDDDDADEAEESPPPPAGPNYITPPGHAALVAELGALGEERSRVVTEVTDAAAQGDRSENAEYIYGKRRLRQIDSRMRFLRKRLERAVVVDPAVDRGDRVFFGATVVTEDERGEASTCQLVGEDEVDADARRISWRSPVGRALLGRSQGDEVTVETPGGRRRLTIVDVRYG